MKKFTKIVLIVIVIILILGIVLTGVGMVDYGVGNFKEAVEKGLFKFSFKNEYKLDFEDDEDGSWENSFGEVVDSEYGVEEWKFNEISQIQGIKVDSEYSTVHILESDEVESITVFGQKGATGDTIEAYLEGGILCVEEYCNNVIDIDVDNSYIRITIPAGMALDSIDIDSDAGAVSYNVETMCKEFQCEIDAGTFSAENINCKTGKITVDAGSIKSKKCYFEDGVVECDAGNINLQQVTAMSDLQLQCDAGKIEVELEGKEADYGFILKCELGSIRINDEEYQGIGSEVKLNEGRQPTIHIGCDIGDVRVNFTEE